ncbi:hypothetical protein DPMN_063604 [Dreissena polymorpha]|uniref:CUB domain-containing protein n=1 Tax=Dreissena polymorpha TaxID=45954 RepID=A0A9D4CB91_DREPO|nr:hypothetical protein DPMN_063604 [Dreissena polymorpha]
MQEFTRSPSGLSPWEDQGLSPWVMTERVDTVGDVKGCHCGLVEMVSHNDREWKLYLPNDREIKGCNSGLVEMVNGCHRGVKGCHRGEVNKMCMPYNREWKWSLPYDREVKGCHRGEVEMGHHHGGCHCGGCHCGSGRRSRVVIGGQGLPPWARSRKWCLPNNREWKWSLPYDREGIKGHHCGGGQGLSLLDSGNGEIKMVVVELVVEMGCHSGWKWCLPYDREVVDMGCHSGGCHSGWGNGNGVCLMTRRSRKWCLPYDREWKWCLPYDREDKGCPSGWKWSLPYDRECLPYDRKWKWSLPYDREKWSLPYDREGCLGLSQLGTTERSRNGICFMTQRSRGCHHGVVEMWKWSLPYDRELKLCLPSDREWKWSLPYDRELKCCHRGVVEMMSRVVTGCHCGVIELGCHCGGCHRGGRQGCHRGEVEKVKGCHHGEVQMVKGCHCGWGRRSRCLPNDREEIKMGCHCGVVEIVKGCHSGRSIVVTVKGCHSGRSIVVTVKGCHRGGGQGFSPWGMTGMGCHCGGCHCGGGLGLPPWVEMVNSCHCGGGKGLSACGRSRGGQRVVIVGEVKGFHRGGGQGLSPWVTEVKGCHRGWGMTERSRCLPNDMEVKGCYRGVVEMIKGCHRGGCHSGGCHRWAEEMGCHRGCLPNDMEVKGCYRGVVEMIKGCHYGGVQGLSPWGMTERSIVVTCPSNVYDRVYRLCQSQRDCNLNELQANLPQFTCKMYINVYMDHICIEVLSNPGFPGNHDGLPSTCYWAIYPDTDRGEEVEITIHQAHSVEGTHVCDTQYLQVCPGGNAHL